MKTKAIRLFFPVPPTANNRLKAGGNHLYQSKESKAYQANVRASCLKDKVKPFQEDVEVTLTWFRTKNMGDLMERFKDLYDALEAEKNYGYGAYNNDRQIAKEIKRRTKADYDGVLIEVKPYDG